MTLDVKIGKIVIDPIDPDLKDWIWEAGSCTVRVNIEQCPDLDYDLCPKEHTFAPREAYRSGSIPLWDFFQKGPARKIYHAMRDNPNSNDRDVARIKPLLDEINKLPDHLGTEVDDDRMKWFKFWCNRAVELYGDLAGVRFS